MRCLKHRNIIPKEGPGDPNFGVFSNLNTPVNERYHLCLQGMPPIHILGTWFHSMKATPSKNPFFLPNRACTQACATARRVGSWAQLWGPKGILGHTEGTEAFNHCNSSLSLITVWSWINSGGHAAKGSPAAEPGTSREWRLHHHQHWTVIRASQDPRQRNSLKRPREHLGKASWRHSTPLSPWW